MARLTTFLGLARDKKILFLGACLELLRAWIIVKKRQFDQHSHGFGEKVPGDQVLANAAITQDVRDIKWAIDLANKSLGGRFTCLMIALAGKSMLNRIGIPNAMVLGAAPGPEGADMLAHAWLRVGDMVVFGGEEMHKYTALLSFVDEPAVAK